MHGNDAGAHRWRQRLAAGPRKCRQWGGWRVGMGIGLYDVMASSEWLGTVRNQTILTKIGVVDVVI